MEIELLLAPISEQAPCGEDLSFAPELDRLREMRRADDPSLDQGAWVHELKTADWPGVAKLASQLLATRSKDLQLVAWLTDAWCQTNGFEGMAQGLALCQQLCARYWDGIFPLSDDGDDEQRVGNLSWLLRQVQAHAANLPILAESERRVGYAAAELAKTRPAHLAEEGQLDADALAKLAQATPKRFLMDTLAHVERAQAELLQLDNVLTEKMGMDGPALSSCKDALEKTAFAVRRYAKERGFLENTPGMDGMAIHEVLAGAEPALSGSAGAVAHVLSAPQTRAQALEQLRVVASFFRRTEPHSPVAYLADKAAHWGTLPLHEWLRTVLKDPAALGHIEEALGVAPRDASGQD